MPNQLEGISPETMTLNNKPAHSTSPPDVIRLALTGQPNVGKSTVFNLLTGMNQHVGNWPGKTVEQKTGRFQHDGLRFEIVDLPGTYSLTANSLEEVIARDFIIRQKPEVVIAILDAATLERNLYLVAELLSLPTKVVIGLNMLDVAKQAGIKVEPEVLQAALGVPVVPMVATKNQGIRELVDAVVQLARGEAAYSPKDPEIREDHQHVLDEIEHIISPHVGQPYESSWVALKLLEGDSEILRMMEEALPQEEWERVHAILARHEDALMAVASGRYEWIGRMVRAAVVRPSVGQITLTSRIDHWATHPIWGLVILAGILGLVFWVTFSIGVPLQEFLEEVVVEGLAEWLHVSLAAAPTWVVALLADGVLAGAGMVITFLPILIIFFIALAILEDTGYLARAAFVMDRLMHLMGLHGKSFLPLLLGFGCNVPAIMGSRIIDSPRARLLTIMITPLVPCAARMAVLAFFTPIFFGGAALFVAWGLIAMSLFTLAVLGILLSRLVMKGELTAFIMELPLYHRPNLRTIGMQVWHNSVHFLKRAGSLILLLSIVVWVLSSQPTGEIETSYLASVGRWLSPLGALLGIDWRMIVALLSSFVAKENTIATISILVSAGQGEAGLAQAIQGVLTPSSALAFLVVQMLFIPCVAAFGTLRQETGSWKWTLLNLVLLLTLSLGAGILVYQIARPIIG